MVRYSDESDIGLLLDAVDQMPFSEDRLAAAERIVEIAQKTEDLYGEYFARYQVGFTAMFLYKRDLVFEAFF